MDDGNDNDYVIAYITDLDKYNYEDYFDDIMRSVEYVLNISGLSFLSLAKLSELNVQTIRKIFNYKDGYFSGKLLISRIKFATVNKLNNLIGKIISRTYDDDDEIH